MKHAGVPFFMNGETYLVPGLSLGQLEDFYPLLSKTPEEQAALSLIQRFDVYLPVVGAAVRRNYSEVRDADLREWLSVEGFTNLLMIVQSASGMREVAPGELGPALSIGDGSTELSSAMPAGPSR